MKLIKKIVLLSLALIVNSSNATTIIQLDSNGEYRWYLTTFIGSGAQGDKLILSSKNRDRWLPDVKECASLHNMDWRLIDSIIKAESAYNYKALSPAGAFGLMQIMKPTAKELGINRENPRENICGGTKYIALLTKSFNEIPLALAAYNAGAGNVRKYNGIPPFKETLNYVKKVLDDYKIQ